MAPRHTLFLIAPCTVGWDALRATIRALPDVGLLGDTAEAAEAVKAILSLRPDLVLLAAQLDEESTAQYIGALRSDWPACRIVVVTERFERREYRFCGRLGVAAYLLREELDAELLGHCLAGTLSPKGLLVGRELAVAFAATAGPPLKVLTASPHDTATIGLESLLSRDPRFVLVGAGRPDGVISLARQLQPDLIVLDPHRGSEFDPAHRRPRDRRPDKPSVRLHLLR